MQVAWSVYTTVCCRAMYVYAPVPLLYISRKLCVHTTTDTLQFLAVMLSGNSTFVRTRCTTDT